PTPIPRRSGAFWETLSGSMTCWEMPLSGRRIAGTPAISEPRPTVGRLSPGPAGCAFCAAAHSVGLHSGFAQLLAAEAERPRDGSIGASELHGRFEMVNSLTQRHAFGYGDDAPNSR